MIIIGNGDYIEASSKSDHSIINKIIKEFPIELADLEKKLSNGESLFLSEEEILLLKMLTELHITRLIVEARQSPLFNENVKDDRRITHVLHREKLYLFPFFRNIMILNSFWEAMDKTLKGECLFEVRFD